jgi:colicin import membrane protein
MTSLAADNPLYRAPRAGETIQTAASVGAALIVHLLLAAALMVSIDWRAADEPEVIQAELWSSLPAERPPTQQAAATPAAEPTPPTPAPPQPTPPAPAPDLSLQRAKEDAAKQEAAKREAAKVQEANRRAQEAKAKAAKAREAQEKQARERQAQERAAEARSLQRQRDALRQAELDRINKSLGLDPNAKAASRGKDTATKAGVVGGAEQGVRSGLLAGYQDAIRSRIRSRIRFDPARAPSNPEVIYIVEQLPTGQISRIELQKASGLEEWDVAVRRAIEASDPLPKADDGSVERRLELRFRPLDKR